MALIDKLNAIGDAIRSKTGKTEKLTLDQMAMEIEGIETLPEEALTIQDDCENLFSWDHWNWFISTYGNQIITKNISKATEMFANSNKLTSIPFSLNFRPTYASKTDYLFSYCTQLTEIPEIHGCCAGTMSYMFRMCERLRYLPENIETYFDWTLMDSSTNAYDYFRESLFDGCKSLRTIPMGFLNHGNPVVGSYYSTFKNLFRECYSLNEIVNLPIVTTATYTSNIFTQTFTKCYRIKNITFAMHSDGTPMIMNWKSQTIDLTTCGYGYKPSYCTQYNSGISTDKEISDSDGYTSLKDDPDSFTQLVEYSRYNHDSAVATINSLPDTSAYLATAGGTNTIKFTGNSGASTDGGAINTLTEEEIAIATAKGWTVTLV